jgi:hypothetical protein
MQFVIWAFATSVVLPVGAVLVARGSAALHEWPVDVLLAYNGVAAAYLATLGVIYAVLVAFVVFVVWGQFNQAQDAIEHEANSIQDLFRVARALPEPARGKLTAAIENYTAKVVEVGWSVMARGGWSRPVAALLEEMWQILSTFAPETPRDQSLYETALARFEEVSDLRNERLLRGRTRLPRPMEGVLLLGSLLTVGSMALFGLHVVGPHLILTLCMAIMVFAILFLVHELDQPFAGLLQVSADPLRLVLEAIRESPGSRDPVSFPADSARG